MVTSVEEFERALYESFVIQARANNRRKFFALLNLGSINE
jgi:hypothetical protein